MQLYVYRPRVFCPKRGCRRSFSKPANLNTHLKSKHNGINVLCGICGEKFTAKSSLQRHLENIHGCSENQLKSKQLDEFEMDRTLQSTEDALLAKVIRLVRENEAEDKVIQELKEKKSDLLTKYVKFLKK